MACGGVIVGVERPALPLEPADAVDAAIHSAVRSTLGTLAIARAVAPYGLGRGIDERPEIRHYAPKRSSDKQIAAG